MTDRAPGEPRLAVWKHLSWALVALLGSLAIWFVAPVLLDLTGLDALRPAR